MAKSTSDEKRNTPLVERLTSLFAVLVGALVGVGAGCAVLYEILASTELQPSKFISKGNSIIFIVLLIGAVISIGGFVGARIGRWIVN